MAAQSLKSATYRKFTPSSWYLKYRNMDDLCVQVRIFRQLSETLPEEESEFPENLDSIEECVINQLADIITDEMRHGFQTDRLGTVLRAGAEAMRAAPLPRKDHFAFGILDLIQQHISSLHSGKINDKVVKLSISVAKQSPYSFLRCKAFELLAQLSAREGVGNMPVQLVNSLLRRNDIWSREELTKVINQWKMMRKRAIDLEQFEEGLKGHWPDCVVSAYA